MVFGSKRGSAPAAANDGDEPDFMLPVEDDEADMLAARANKDRRAAADRRNKGADRRASTGRRGSEYAPARQDAPRLHAAEDSKRGPLLLAGALLIVIVFAVVVWNAYRDGLQGEDVEVTPELSTGGYFKTPPRVVADAPVASDGAVEAAPETLDGGNLPADAADEQRVAPTPVAPGASKVMATPPAPLKDPVTAAASPVQAAAAKPIAAAPVAATPTPKPVEPAPVAKPAPAKVTPPKVEAALAPAATPAPAGAYKPAFSGGNHVVQIAASTSQDAATAEWNKLSKAYPDMLAGGERLIVEADVNGKTVYRVRVGSFGSKADAAAFCAAFKAKGGNCFPAVK